MERGIVQGRFGPGGIVGLAVVVRDHAKALEYDLMTMTGRTLSEYVAMGADGMHALVAFVRYLPPESALYRESNPGDEMGEWSTVRMTNAVLADIHDQLHMLRAEHAVKGSKRRPMRVRPYPRPNARRDERIGRGAIPVRDFDEWWASGN